MRKRLLVILQGMLVILISATLFLSLEPPKTAQAAPTPVGGLPTITFEGFGIGARFNNPIYPTDQQPPVTPWTVELKADVFDRLYYAGQTAQLKIIINNPTTEALSVGGKVAVAAMDEAQLPNDGVQIIPVEGLQTVDVPTQEIAAGAKREVDFSFKGPRNGVFAIYTQLTNGTISATNWQGNLGYIFRHHEGSKPDSYFMGDTRSVDIPVKRIEMGTMQKMGVKWSRGGEATWSRVQPTAPNVWDWSFADEEVDMFRDFETYMIYLGGHTPDWTRDYEQVTRDVTNRPAYYGQHATFYYNLINRYKDIIRAVNIWNEPWEDTGITGWESTAQHYRNLSRYAWQGVKLADPGVLVGGNDSHDNIHDSMLSSTDWPELFDLMTYHGSDHSAMYVNRLADLPMWNTENWYTSQLPSTVQESIFQIAAGAEKVNMFAVGNFFSGNTDSGGYYNPGPNPPQLSPQPNAIGYSALTHFLEDTTFHSEPNPGHIPYSYIFKGKDRYVAVMFGTPIEPKSVELSQVQKPGQMQLLDSTKTLKAYDKFGNPYERAADGSYTMPFNVDPVYVEATSLEQLNTALKGVTVKETNPVQVTLYDLTKSLDQQQDLRFTLTNALPQSITGSVEITLPQGWTAEKTQLPLDTLKGGESRSYAIKLTAATPLSANSYPIAIKVTTPFGASEWKENIEVHVIAKGTPVLDGNPESDWNTLGAIPIQIGDPTPDPVTGIAPTNGQVALMHDDNNLYILAKVHDVKEDLVTDQTGPWYDLYPHNYMYSVDPQWPFNGDQIQLAIDSRENADEYLYPKDDPARDRYQLRAVDYLFGFHKTKDGQAQSWQYRQPGSDFRNRYPFSPATQGLAPGTQTVINRVGTTTYYEIALPLDLVPDLKQRATVKLAVKLADHWGGPTSNWGRSSGRSDSSVFYPRWSASYSVGTEWGFAPVRPAEWDSKLDEISSRVEYTPETSLGGLQAEYYDDQDFGTRKLTRKDAQVNFDWHFSSPVTVPIRNTFGHAPENLIEPDTFAARWKGQITARFSETYTFKVETDGNTRLWINGQKVIDNWYQLDNPLEGTIKLEAGKSYDFKMEYKHNTGASKVRLHWSSPSQLSQIVPQKQFTAPKDCCSTAIKPEPPAQLDVVPGQKSVELSWSLSAGATSYVVKRGTSPDGPFVPQAYNLTKPHYTDNKNVQPGKVYYYVVEAVSEKGVSGNSHPIRALPSLVKIYEAESGTIHTPAYRTNDAYASNGHAVSGTGQTPGGGVTLEGIDGGKGGDYILALRYATGADNASRTVSINGVASQVSFPNTGADGYAEKAYSLVTIPVKLVAGKNNTIAVTQEASNQSNVTIDAFWISPVDNQAPTAPTNVSVTEKTNVSLSLRWNEANDNIGVVGYRVYDGTTLVGATNGYPGLTLSELLPGQTYNLTVRALDAVGNLSEPSAVLAVTTDPTPINLKAVVLAEGIELKWTGSMGEGITYNVKRGDGPDGPFTVLASGITTTTYLDTTVLPDTPYFYVVTATTSAGESGPTNVASNTGLKGEYFDNKDLTNLVTTRTDGGVDFIWGDKPEGTAITDGDTFSVRWTGQVTPQYSETYTFYTLSDDGVRLWVNGQLLVDDWSDHAPSEKNNTITLTAGQRYDIRLEFYESGGGAQIKLSWSSPGQPKQVIPSGRLTSTAG